MSQKILVIDDSRTVRKAVEWVFHGSPFTVLSASTASEAMKLLRSERPDVALVDYHLPDQGGFEFCADVRGDASLEGIALIVIGGTHHPFDVARVTSSGANDHIMKPFKTDALVEKVTSVLSRAHVRPLQMTPASVDAVGAGPPPMVPPSLRPQPTPLPDLPALPEIDAVQPSVGRAVPPAPPAMAPQPTTLAPPPAPQTPPALRPPAAPQPVAAPQPPPAPQPASATGASPSGFRRVAPPEPEAAAPAAPTTASNGVTIDAEMVQQAVREVVPGIVKEVLADLLRQTIGPRVEQYAMRKIDDFTERDLLRLAEEAIEKQLQALDLGD